MTWESMNILSYYLVFIYKKKCWSGIRLLSFTGDMAGMFSSGVSTNPKEKNNKMKEGQGIVSSGCGNGWKGLGDDRRDGVH